MILKESESAFVNADPAKRPHRIVDGKRVENARKNRDKYTQATLGQIRSMCSYS